MKRRVIGLVMVACMTITMLAGCGKPAVKGVSRDGSDAVSPESYGLHESGMPIVDEKIELTAWIEGGSDIDWENNGFVKEVEEKSNIHLNIISTPLADALEKRNLMLSSGDYPDIIFTDWNAIVTKSDAMNYGVKEGIFIPINDLLDKYGNNMKRIFDENPTYKESSTAPDGNIYGFARFSECYHCSAYPKAYIRQDWLDKLGLDMPETTEELRNVLEHFVNDDPNGNGEKDEIGIVGATKWNTMLEYALMGMSFQTVKPDFWLSLGKDGESVEFSPSTDAYREGLRYMKSLYDEGLIDPASFTQTDEQMAQTVRTEPHIVGIYICDHAGMGYDTADVAEAENYQIMPPVAGPDGFRKQGQNAGEGEIGGYEAVITDKCKYPEAAFRLIDEFFYDDYYNMVRVYGKQGQGWDYAPEGTKNVFGEAAKYVILPLSDEEKEKRDQDIFTVGPQADLAEFRLSMLPEVDDIYAPENYEQRITLDTKKVEQYIPEKRLQYTVFIPEDMADEYSEIQANLNNFVRMTTVQFIMGERDIENGWEDYKKELEGYKVDRYIEIYKTAIGDL